MTRTYDGFNRLKKAVTVKSGDRSEIEFTYNGDGLRTQKTVRSAKTPDIAKETNYVYDRQHVILELDSSGKLSTRYIRGINYIARMNQAEKYTYYLYNGHGDVVQTVTASGEVQNQYDYDVFGNRTLTIEVYAESIQYAGEFYDAESGLYYLRARYYDPYTARFISEDSYRGEDTNPLSLNLYTYAHNNPILFLDPTGHWAAGDEKLNVEAQAKIIALTNAYYKAVTDAEKKAISAQATTVRTTAGAADKSVVTPLQFQAARITEIVVQGTSKGYATEKEWRQTLQSVGIGATNSERKQKTDVSSGGARNITYSTVNSVTIGRTNLTVTVNSSSRTINSTKVTTDSAAASLAMSYEVTANELKFIADTASYMGSLEKSLYVIDAVKSNKGTVTSKILKDAKLQVAKGPMGTVDMLNFTYDMSEKGFTVSEALKMYKEEVTDPRLAEAYATVTLNLAGSGFSLKKMAQGESRVSITKSPSKSKVDEYLSNSGTVGAQRNTSLATPGGNGAFKNGVELPGDAIILRGGLAKPGDLIANQKLDLKNNTLSANGGMGVSNEILSSGLKNNQISVVSVGKLNDAGYKVIATPTNTNPYHVSIYTPGGIKLNDNEAARLSSQFTQVPNPSKK